MGQDFSIIHENVLWVIFIYTLVYGIVLIFLNIIHAVNGPYPFLMVYEQPVWATLLWAITILGGVYGLSILLKFLRKQK